MLSEVRTESERETARRERRETKGEIGIGTETVTASAIHVQNRESVNRIEIGSEIITTSVPGIGIDVIF
jgi:hypothetical protein